MSASLTIIFLASFSDVTAIIFVVACSSYNLVLREDPSQVSEDPGRYSDPYANFTRQELCCGVFEPLALFQAIVL